MKTVQISSFVTLGLIGAANAYPSIMEHMGREALRNEKRFGLPGMEKRQAPGVIPPFDPVSQYVSNKGDHVFVPPGEGDQRGPCPGLNAMANHNYMPHNGVATIAQFIEGTNRVFGMGADLATFLSTYGAVMDGDGTKWSIGGPTPFVGAPIGLLGTPQGISGSHNKYEADVSPTRGDLYQYGNNYLVQIKQFQALYDLGKAEDSYDLKVLTKHRVNRFAESIANNPYFFNGPFSGVAVQPAAYTFIYRFMANKSAEYPEGRLNGEVLKSFFSITGDAGNFKYTPGYEKIPDNWYKRNQVDAYTIPYFEIDLNNMARGNPQFLAIGGNTGTTNSFTGVDLSSLTNGVYNSKNLLEGNNLACFAFQAGIQATPDVANAGGLLTKLNSAFTPISSSLGCPKLGAIQTSQYDKFPGYTKLRSNGNYRR